jgi:hypothetical protein
MKNRLLGGSLFIFLVLFPAGLLHAADLRVAVSMFEGKEPDKDAGKELGRRMGILCSEEIMRTKGLRYISPTELFRNVTEDEKIMPDKVVDLEKEYSDKNIEYLNKMAEQHKNRRFTNFFKLLDSVDIMAGGTVQRNGPLVRVELMLHRGETWEDYEATIESEEGSLDAKVREKFRELLKKISRPVKIYADRLVDAKESVVRYFVKATDNSDIIVDMKYTAERPDPQTLSVLIFPPEGLKREGVKRYRVKCDGGKLLDITFTFRNGETDSVKVDTPVPDPSNKTKQSEVLTFKSNAGHILKFDFEWDGGDIKSAKLYPAVNPFGRLEVE